MREPSTIISSNKNRWITCIDLTISKIFRFYFFEFSGYLFNVTISIDVAPIFFPYDSFLWHFANGRLGNIKCFWKFFLAFGLYPITLCVFELFSAMMNVLRKFATNHFRVWTLAILTINTPNKAVGRWNKLACANQCQLCTYYWSSFYLTKY